MSAASVIDAILADCFWILTHCTFDSQLEERHRSMLESGTSPTPVVDA